jgi:hypothetical protein
VSLWSPGTGKSEFVRYLAHRLGRPLEVRRASDILDKYVGGTEQNIASAFESALRDEALLLFDEADSFLQDRGGAQRSWEVTAVNEFLQQLEVFPGVVACTTNLFDKLDQASLRRFVFKIEFKFLRPEQSLLAFRRTLTDLGYTGEVPAAVEIELTRIPNLAPGDFAAVKRRLTGRGKPVSSEILLAELQAEVRVKSKLEGKDRFLRMTNKKDGTMGTSDDWEREFVPPTRNRLGVAREGHQVVRAWKIPKPVVLVDTREQLPWRLVENHPNWIGAEKRVALKAGDYSIEGMQDLLALERKSMPDAIRSVTADRARFIASCARLGQLRWKAIVIEATYEDMKSPYDDMWWAGDGCASERRGWHARRHRGEVRYSGSLHVADWRSGRGARGELAVKALHVLVAGRARSRPRADRRGRAVVNPAPAPSSSSSSGICDDAPWPLSP